MLQLIAAFGNACIIGKKRLDSQLLSKPRNKRPTTGSCGDDRSFSGKASEACARRSGQHLIQAPTKARNFFSMTGTETVVLKQTGHFLYRDCFNAAVTVSTL